MSRRNIPQLICPAGGLPALKAAVCHGADAVILADVGLLDYAARRHPDLRLHLSVQGSATSYEAVNFPSANSACGARCCRAC